MLKIFSWVWRVNVIFIILAVFISSAALAQGSKVNTSVGYRINGSASEGTLIATDSSSAGTGKAATTQAANDLIGVVVAPEEPLLTVSSGSNQRQIAISGIAYALVSDINGDVKKGGYVTPSPITGVGMKATSATRVLGLAQNDLASVSTQTTQTKDAAGKPITTKVGRILVLVNIGYYAGPPNSYKGLIPRALQDFSDTIAGRQVSPIRILTSFSLVLVALVISVTLAYSAVRSSIISIGRNPLSKSPVRKSLIQILGLISLILLVTLISVYLILSR